MFLFHSVNKSILLLNCRVNVLRCILYFLLFLAMHAWGISMFLQWFLIHVAIELVYLIEDVTFTVTVSSYLGLRHGFYLHESNVSFIALYVTKKIGANKICFCRSGWVISTVFSSCKMNCLVRHLKLKLLLYFLQTAGYNQVSIIVSI